MTPILQLYKLPDQPILLLFFNMSNRWLHTYENQLRFINNYLANPKNVNREQHTIFPREVVSQIRMELDRLKEDYSFKYQFKTPEEFIQDQSVRSARRLVKLRFRCKNQNCKQFKRRTSDSQKSSQLQRHWTSYNGLADFKFILTVDSSKRKPTCQIVFTFRLFKQKCQTCLTWGKSGLIESCFEQLLNLYSLFIQNSLIVVRKNREFQSVKREIQWGPAEKYGKKLERFNESKSDGRNTGHIEELCEACLEQVCPRFYQQKAAILQVVCQCKRQFTQEASKKKYKLKTEAKFEEDYAEFIVRPTRQ